MKKTYTIKELSIILDTKEHNIYNWIRYAIPEDLRPNKGWNEEVKRETYIFDDRDLDILIEIKDLKSDGFTYKAIKEMLPELIYNVYEEPIFEPMNLASEPFNQGISPPTLTVPNESKDIEVTSLVFLIITLIVNLLILYKIF